MPKKAIIFHGTGCRPTDFWYPWLAEQLKSRGYEVDIPSYPKINREPVETFLPKVLQRHQFDEHTVLIGHSAGATLLLSILEHIDVIIPQAILVAGFARPLPNPEPDVILQPHYNWNQIKQHVGDIVFINSVNDPWGCNDEQGRHMFNQLGGTQIIKADGHFGSTSKNQPYRTFELLNRIIADV